MLSARGRAFSRLKSTVPAALQVKMELAYTKTAPEVLKRFSVSEQQGLTEAQVKQSRETHGRNGESNRCVAPHLLE